MRHGPWSLLLPGLLLIALSLSLSLSAASCTDDWREALPFRGSLLDAPAPVLPDLQGAGAGPDGDGSPGPDGSPRADGQARPDGSPADLLPADGGPADGRG